MSRFLKPEVPALILAPMEGVTDAPMRALLAERGGFSFCVSEFLRISQDVQPARTFIEHVPELKAGCETPSGLPVQFQLLGGNPELLAEAAFRACETGARAIDLNFGCPAQTVNRHDGGATLLKYPLRLRGIVETVRRACPPEIPVSAKLRLGFDNPESIHENSEMAAQGGAAWITIHGRTKTQGYIPPAYWLPIGEVRRRLGIPVVANGEIWTLDDFRRCQDETGSIHYMIGRGALADPLLSLRIAGELGIPLASTGAESDAPEFGAAVRDWLPLLRRFSELCSHYTQPHQQTGRTSSSSYSLRRIKQWVRLANTRRDFPWFEALKKTQTLDELFELLKPLAS